MWRHSYVYKKHKICYILYTCKLFIPERNPFKDFLNLCTK